MRRISICRTVGTTLAVAVVSGVMLFASVSPSAADENDDSPFVGTPPGWDKKSRPGIGFPPFGKHKKPGKKDGKFHLVEATIADIHGALHRREITCERLMRLYFKRIKAYSGHCVKYDTNGDGVSPDYDFFMPSGKGVYLGVVERDSQRRTGERHPIVELAARELHRPRLRAAARSRSAVGDRSGRRRPDHAGRARGRGGTGSRSCAVATRCGRCTAFRS